MQQKNIKEILKYSAPIVALLIGNMIGLSQAEQGALHDSLVITGTGILAILGILGVIKNNDKSEEE